MPQILVFDVNDTLLDPAALDSHFAQNFGSVAVRKGWFRQVLQMGFVTAIIDAYSDFSIIAEAALEVIDKWHQKSLSSQQRCRIFETMRKLPPHPDLKGEPGAASQWWFASRGAHEFAVRNGGHAAHECGPTTLF